MNQFLKRSVLAVVGIPVLVFTALWGGWWLAALMLALTLPAMGEYYTGVQRGGGRPVSALGYMCAIGLVLITVFGGPEYRDSLTILLLFIAVLFSFISCLDRPSSHGALHDTATTIFGLVYVAIMMMFYVRLRDLDLPTMMNAGPVFLGGHVSSLFLVLVPAWALDTVAYTVGRAFGKHRLAPKLSPHKTLEGAIAGFLAAVVFTVFLGVYWNHIPWGHALVLGALIGVLGQLGDLSESALKRDIGVKDFGTMFGPHGGVLDRFDNMLFVMPLAYFYLWIVFVAASHPGF